MGGPVKKKMSEFCSSDVLGERGSIPLDIDNVHLLLQGQPLVTPIEKLSSVSVTEQKIQVERHFNEVLSIISCHISLFFLVFHYTILKSFFYYFVSVGSYVWFSESCFKDLSKSKDSYATCSSVLLNPGHFGTCEAEHLLQHVCQTNDFSFQQHTLCFKWL